MRFTQHRAMTSPTSTPPLSASPSQYKLEKPQHLDIENGEITKYRRPQQVPRLLCPQCNENPIGFRGEHELRRHHDRAHNFPRKVWICVDPHTETAEGWRPQRSLDICKQCREGKQYNIYYNAAAHLRHAHFSPRKRGRQGRTEERGRRGGERGIGNIPPIDWLKSNGFLVEIEVGPDSYNPTSQLGTLENKHPQHFTLQGDEELDNVDSLDEPRQQLDEKLALLNIIGSDGVKS